MQYIFEKNSGTNHHSLCVMCLTEMKFLEGTGDCIVLYVSVLSLALLYVSAERIHVNECLLFYIETIGLIYLTTIVLL